MTFLPLSIFFVYREYLGPRIALFFVTPRHRRNPTGRRRPDTAAGAGTSPLPARPHSGQIPSPPPSAPVPRPRPPPASHAQAAPCPSCEKTGRHRTGAKNRVLYYAYIEMCNQLEP
ncbi:unnamed protein product [Urochloa humidicola]